MWKWIIVLVLLLGVAVVGTAGIVLATSSGARDYLKTRWVPDKLTEVRLGKVLKGDLVRTVNAPGSIEPKTKVQISAQVAARIVALPFREGENVKAGDTVVRLDNRDLAAALESAQASLRAEESRLIGAQALVDQTKADLARVQELFKTRDVSQQQLDDSLSASVRANSSLLVSQHNIEMARAQIARVQRDLDNTVITAPFDGTIVKLNAEVGELVLVGTLNNAASVIMEIADLAVMLMKARVDEANISPVKPAQNCRVYINAFTGQQFPARVERVGLKRLIDRDGTGYFEVEILLEKPKDLVLGSGLTANTDIQVQTFTDVLKVPSQAVVDRRLDTLPAGTSDNPLIDKSKSFARVVYTVENGKAKSIPVVTGTSDLTDTIITAGVPEGTAIVTGPFKVLVDLADGAAVVEEGTLKKKGAEAGKDGAKDAGKDDQKDAAKTTDKTTEKKNEPAKGAS